MKKDDQTEFGLRRETGELYMLNKNERILVIELRKVTLAAEAGKEFLKERFGREGMKIAGGLLEEMGVQIRRQ